MISAIFAPRIVRQIYTRRERAMPELPDITIYREAIEQRTLGHTLTRLSIRSPFLLRTFDPPADAAEGRRVTAIARMGKRIVISLEGDLHLVIHLMIAGRFRWHDPADPLPKPSKIELARLTFSTGTLALTEASTKKRAALHIIHGAAALQALRPPGLELFDTPDADLIARLRSENRTLKRALTDPRLLSGIGNAYSDEILHAARLSPTALTQSLTDEAAARLITAAKDTLTRWTNTLRADFAARFPGPGDITAFRQDFAAHGRFGKPCPTCGTTIQRIIHTENETNYCPRCQTNGRILADRSLSRLLKDDWPKTVEEWEGMQ
jgi:formamidopyrimidine-DNA glycosylase